VFQRLLAVCELETPVDAWIASDKAQHFLACASIALVAFFSASLVDKLHRYRLWAGTLLGCLLGLLKELGDYLQVQMCLPYTTVYLFNVSFLLCVQAETI
jgi:hypothetical protein